MSEGRGGLSVWQLCMLAMGTVVGGSFFLGSAVAIRSSGLSVLPAYLIGALLVYIILMALSEMVTADPVPGSFRTYAERAFGPAAGFLVGWVYWTGLVLAMSSEASAAAIFLRSWIPDVSLPAIAITIIVGVTLINLLTPRVVASLESSLALIKLLAILGFILLAFLLIAGLLPGREPIGLGEARHEQLLPHGIGGVAGSMLMVLFTYAGFEVIGLAASESNDPHRTVPKAILMTIIGLSVLYTAAIALLLPLIPTGGLTEQRSPFVAALDGLGFRWAAGIMNIILVTAILSTMLAATFGLGRMIKSLSDEGYAPSWLKGRGDIPRMGILFSGAAMLAGVAMGYVLPSGVYLFLVSSGGFSLLFTYLVILASHYKFRERSGCPPKGHCQLPWYPYTNILGLIALAAIILSMPLIRGQGAGLKAGLLLLVVYYVIYLLFKQR